MNEPSSENVDLDHLRTWIGREEVATDVISVDLVRKFNAMLDLAAGTPKLGDIAPLLVHYCLAQPAAATAQLGDDGHPPKGGFLPPVPLPRRMWAGSSLAFHGDLKVGDEVRRVSRIADVSVKEGRSGALCFVTVEHRLDVAGSLKIEETQNIVYREAATVADVARPALPEPAPSGTSHRPVMISTPLLFRYSALTFNGHRIHYDRPYATEVEFYPGLVVHGPLQATLLLNYATQLKCRPPTTFTFRGLSPIFDQDQASMHAVEKDGVLTLWTARETGPVAMSAEARWS